jgi:hypothetical protein
MLTGYKFVLSRAIALIKTVIMFIEAGASIETIYKTYI